MSELSPAAQAVVDAAVDAYDTNYSEFHCCANHVAVAALRAAVEQVVPSDVDEPRNYLPMAMECQRIRAEILAIANELKAQ